MTHNTNLLQARQQVLEHFRWIGGDADTWTMLRDAEALSAVVKGLAELMRDERLDVLVGVESRGFALGPAVAVALGIGFSPVRKEGALFPGDVIHQKTAPDYRGSTRDLAVRRDHFAPGERVGLVDDWIETGSQAMAVQGLIAAARAELVSVAVIIDEATDAARAGLPAIRSIIVAADLG